MATSFHQQDSDIQVWFVQAVGGGRGRPALAGGGAWHVVELGRAYRQLGFEVTFLTNEQDSIPQSAPTFFDHLVRLPSIGDSIEQLRFVDFVSVILQVPRVLNLSRKLLPSPRVFISASPFLPDLLTTSILAVRSKGLPVFMMHHVMRSPFWFPTRRGGLARTAVLWLQQALGLSLAKLISAPVMINQTQIEELAQTCGGLSTVVDYGLTELNQLGTTDQKSRLQPLWDACFLGRPTPQKGFSDLLEAWARICLVDPSRRLALLLSSTSEEIEVGIKRVLEAKGLSRRADVVVNPDRAMRTLALSSSRVLVLPSYEEGWSLTAMEAAVLGTPMVAYDLPAYSYLKDGLFPVRPGNVDELAEAITQVWRDQDNATRVAAVAQKAVLGYRAEILAIMQTTQLKAEYRARVGGGRAIAR